MSGASQVSMRKAVERVGESVYVKRARDPDRQGDEAHGKDHGRDARGVAGCSRGGKPGDRDPQHSRLCRPNRGTDERVEGRRARHFRFAERAANGNAGQESDRREQGSHDPSRRLTPADSNVAIEVNARAAAP